MKKLLLSMGIFIATVMVAYLASQTSFVAQATSTWQCGTSKTYYESSDEVNSVYEVDYKDYDYKITVKAKSGYKIKNVWLDVSNDGKDGFYLYATGELNNFNPPGNDIKNAKIEVEKICPYQLNLSHIECVDGKVEVHFVLLNVPDGITPGTLSYTYGSIPAGKKTGNVWHYTDYKSDGYFNITSASVMVDGSTVNLHNPGEYKGTYDCEPDQCVETVSCPDTCRASDQVIQGQCGPITCRANAPAAQSCPTECGLAESDVPNGQCGMTHCNATQVCPTETPEPTPTAEPTPTPTSEPEPTPTAEPTPTPTSEPEPTPTAEPTPTPTSEPEPTPTGEPEPSVEPSSTPQPTPSETPGVGGRDGKQSSLSYDKNQCSEKDIEAVFDVTDNGNPVKDVKVTFEFNGSTKEAHTNENGRAKASFGRSGGTLKAKADGYPSQSSEVPNLDCPATSSVSTPVTQPAVGQVLGATTLANTGTATEALAQGVSLLGAVLSSAAVASYAKKK